MPPTFTRDIRPVLLCLSPPSRLFTPTGLSPSMAWRSSQLRLHNLEGIRAKAAKPHISPVLPQGIRFALCPVRSPLLRASRLLSFPAGTQMFHFPAFPLLTERLGFTPGRSPIRASRVPRLPAPRPGLSQLVTPFVGARAEPSPRWRTAAKPTQTLIQIALNQTCAGPQ